MAVVTKAMGGLQSADWTGRREPLDCVPLWVSCHGLFLALLAGKLDIAAWTRYASGSLRTRGFCPLARGEDPT